MRIGIIAEGHADRAVIENILTGLTGLDSSCFIALRPSDLIDETDKAKKHPSTFGSWTHVKAECETRQLIDPFLLIEDQEFIALQIDSAEAHLYGVTKPNSRTKSYCFELRELIVDKVNEWLVDDLSDSLLYAIAIEEIDAWILTLHENHASSKFLDAKGRLSRVLRRKDINSTSNYHNYQSLSHEFSKSRAYRTDTYLSRNCSLKAFCVEVTTKVIPKLATAAISAAKPEE